MTARRSDARNRGVPGCPLRIRDRPVSDPDAQETSLAAAWPGFVDEVAQRLRHAGEQILALGDPALAERVEARRAAQTQAVDESPE